MKGCSIRSRTSMAIMLAFAAAVALPGTAAASVAGGIIRNSGCNGPYTWRGDLPYDNAYNTQYYQTTGTVKQCVTFYQQPDNDPGGDYYAIDDTVTWTNTYSGATRGDNYGMVTLSSSIAAINGMADGDPDHSVAYSGNCAVPLSLGLNYQIFSVSAAEIFCSSGHLNLTWLGTASARWGSPDVTRTPKWEVIYMVKVPQGAKPKLSATLGYPTYNIWRDATTLYWHYGKNWTQVTKSYTIP